MSFKRLKELETADIGNFERFLLQRNQAVVGSWGVWMAESKGSIF